MTKTYPAESELAKLRRQARKSFAEVCETCKGSGRQVHVERYEDSDEINHDLSYDERCDDCDGQRGWND